MIGFGFYQSIIINAENYLIRGLNPNHHVFSSLLAIIFITVFPTLLIQKNKFYKFLAIFFALGVYVTVTSPPALIALLCGCFAQLLLIALHYVSWKNSKVVLISLSSMIILCFAILIKPKNVANMSEYFYPFEPNNVNERYSRIQAILELSKKNIGFGNYRFAIENISEKSIYVPNQFKFNELNNEKLISQRLVERFVSLNMASNNPLTGVGLGKYDQEKDLYFGSIVKVNTTEPFTYSSLATALGTGGIVFLIGILAMFADRIYNVYRKYIEGVHGKSLNLGGFGACIVFIVLAYQIEVFIAPFLILFVVISSVGDTKKINWSY